MSQKAAGTETARFEVRNIGGIEATEVEFRPGVTALTGKNATNRTSFLRAIMAALGSRDVSLKGDASEGSVTLTMGGEEYTRTLTRKDGTVTFGGDPMLEDPEVADLFAFLLESNEPRQAVSRGADLRDLIMRPVDTYAIKEEIQELEARKDSLSEELAEIEDRKSRLPELEQQRTELREQISAKRDELADLETEIDENSRNIEESRQEQDRLETKLQDLRSTRSEIESLRRQIESQEESIASLKQERESVETEYEDLPDEPMDELAGFEADIERLRERRQSLNSKISELQSLIQYNEERLEAGDLEVFDSLEEAPTDGGHVAEQLIADDDDELVCWTCGSTVEQSQIETTVDRLKELSQQKVRELNEVKDELAEQKSARSEVEATQERRETLEAKRADIEDELDRRTARVDSLKEQRSGLTEEVETLEAEIEALESEDFDDILDLHTQANQLEFEIDSLESDLESTTEEIESIEADLERADDLEATRETVTDDLTELRTRIDQIEADAVEAFNHHMDALLDTLAYENLDRIWIERVEESVREGRKTVEKTVFELHIVRTTENGAAYEDTIEHLSESERKVTGLIFALAGYLVHDLHEVVPFMLLDSLEAIDSDRIAALVEYFSDFADYLVVALLPEDAQALDDEYTRLTEL